MSNSNRLHQLDYLKAIAILLIILTHSLQSIGQYTDALYIGRPFWIDMAVPVLMILSRYSYSLSSKRNGILKVRDWYDLRVFLPKVIRILLPYFLIMVFQTFVYQFIAPKTLNQYIFGYVTGGWGPGSYYVTILVQLLFVFPFIYLLVKEKPLQGYIVFFVLNFTFDATLNLLVVSDMVDLVYRLSFLKYLAFLTTGIMYYLNKEKIQTYKFGLMVLVVLSTGYITICNYFGYTPIFFSLWTVASLPTVFWAFALVILGIQFLLKDINNQFTKVASNIGKASYHVFLIQMIYFNLGFGKLGYIQNMIICILFGLLFYNMEDYLSKYINIKLMKIRS